jgi:hypothetical protein
MFSTNWDLGSLLLLHLLTNQTAYLVSASSQDDKIYYFFAIGAINVTIILEALSPLSERKACGNF